jgi:hypothetical protein
MVQIMVYGCICGCCDEEDLFEVMDEIAGELMRAQDLEKVRRIRLFEEAKNESGVYH